MTIRQSWLALLAALSCTTAASAAATTAAPMSAPWNQAEIASLKRWADEAPSFAIPPVDMAALTLAEATGNPAAIDSEATALALRLARMHLLGCTPAAAHAGWHIADSDSRMDVTALLGAALASGSIDGFFAGLLPTHPDYAQLRSAYAAETDPARRTQIARNMERWRWMPHDLGRNYIIVNAAAFEAGLWRGGVRSDTWKVIVGKPKSPTPVFQASVTGVTFNPWWDVPANIVRESVGALTRKHPALARQRGYVWGGGRYRQRPGPGNSLGAMKLVMPNPFNVYLHDTPTKALFEKDVRAFSHGCIRVGDALGFASALLGSLRSREEIDQIVADGVTTTIPLSAAIPVYVTYFTAGTRADGSFALLGDIYGRDGAMGDAANPHRLCPA